MVSHVTVTNTDSDMSIEPDDAKALSLYTYAEMVVL